MPDDLSPLSPPLVDDATLTGRNILNQTRIGKTGRWTLERLLSLTQAEGIALWRTLPPVLMHEMHGHYFGAGPDGLDPAHQDAYAARMYDEESVTGYWLGKAFRPLTNRSGEGYNRWRMPNGRVLRNMRMATRVGPSLVDGKPAFILDYSAFSSSTLIDEVRKLDDFIYLAVAHTKTEDGGRTPPRFFFLTGPTDEWVGT